MIEITYGHKIKGNILYIKKLSIGRGLPRYGQLSFLSLIEEEIDLENGQVIWAIHKWGYFRKAIKK